jgi:hypothetical protein
MENLSEFTHIVESLHDFHSIFTANLVFGIVVPEPLPLPHLLGPLKIWNNRRDGTSTGIS